MPASTPKPLRRYHPYLRPPTLHLPFSPERPFCPAHALHTIYVIDPDPTPLDPPLPIVHREAEASAVSYFVNEATKPNQQPIPKPRGEVGRPNGHGYNLSAALGWPLEVYKEVQSTIHDLAKEGLPTQTFSNQKATELETFYNSLSKKYPYLEFYEGNWAVADFLRMYLKNRVHSSKK